MIIKLKQRLTCLDCYIENLNLPKILGNGILYFLEVYESPLKNGNWDMDKRKNCNNMKWEDMMLCQ